MLTQDEYFDRVIENLAIAADNAREEAVRLARRINEADRGAVPGIASIVRTREWQRRLQSLDKIATDCDRAIRVVATLYSHP